MTVSPAVTYVIDPSHSTAGFKVRHLIVSNVAVAIQLEVEMTRQG
jgi:polyisoprenoid-binding protein YceI